MQKKNENGFIVRFISLFTCTKVAAKVDFPFPTFGRIIINHEEDVVAVQAMGSADCMRLRRHGTFFFISWDHLFPILNFGHIKCMHISL